MSKSSTGKTSRSAAAKKAAATRALQAPIKPIRLPAAESRALAGAAATARECWLDSHPAGGTDRGGRWYPSDAERAECCGSIYEPSRAHPWTLFKHCHSDAHRIARDGVDAKTVRAVKRLLGAQAALLPDGERLDAAAVVGMVERYGLEMAKRLTAVEMGADEVMAVPPTLGEVVERERALRMVRALNRDG